MAKNAGRLAVVSKAGTPIAGVKVSTIKWAAESIDVTDKDSAGITELLAAVASQQITLSCEGVYSSPVLRDIAFDTAASKLLTDLTFKFGDALAAKDTVAGNFFFANYEEGNPHDDASTFTCEFQSSGTWTHS
ncbi:MAG: phage tail tube protein [Microgenomates group bacterium]